MFKAIQKLFLKNQKNSKAVSVIKFFQITQKNKDCAYIKLSKNSLCKQERFIFIQRKKDIEFIKGHEPIAVIDLENNSQRSQQPINDAFPIVSINGNLQDLEINDIIEVQKDPIVRGPDFRIIKTNYNLEATICGFQICNNRFNPINDFFEKQHSEITSLLRNDNIRELIAEDTSIKLSKTITGKRFNGNPDSRHLEIFIEDKVFDLFIKKNPTQALPIE